MFPGNLSQEEKLKSNLGEVCIFVCEAVTFLKSSPAAHLWEKDNSSVGWGVRLRKIRKSKKLPETCAKRNPQRSARHSCPCWSHRSTPSLAETPVHIACTHLSRMLQGDPYLRFPASLLRPPLVRAALLRPLHQNKTLRNDPAARHEAVSGRRQMAGAGEQM